MVAKGTSITSGYNIFHCLTAPQFYSQPILADFCAYMLTSISCPLVSLIYKRLIAVTALTTAKTMAIVVVDIL